MQPSFTDADTARTMTLEAFADTIVPGKSAGPDDRAVAGVSHDGGSVAAGALELLESPAGGLSQWLGGLAGMLNGHAQNTPPSRESTSMTAVPAFVTPAVRRPGRPGARLTAPDHPEQDGWVHLVMFCNMAYDTARAPAHRGRARRGPPRPAGPRLRAAGRRRAVAVPRLLLRPPARRAPPGHHPLREPRMSSTENTDVLVIGSGFGGAIAAYHLAAGGARVIVLERGPWLDGRGLRPRLQARLILHPDLRVHRGRRHERARRQLRRRRQRRLLRHHAPRAAVTSSTARAASAAGCGRPRSAGTRLEPWYDRVAEALPVTKQKLGRRCPTPAGCGPRPATTPGTPQPGSGRDRHRAVHQLQLDDVRLQVRRQAVAAAQLPAGRARARRRDPAAARGAADHPQRRRRLPGALQHPGRRSTTGCSTGSGVIDAKI